MKKLLLCFNFLSLFILKSHAQATEFKNEVGLGLGELSYLMSSNGKTSPAIRLMFFENKTAGSNFYFYNGNILTTCTPKIYYGRIIRNNFLVNLSYQYFQIFNYSTSPLYSNDAPTILSYSELNTIHEFILQVNYICFKTKKIEGYVGGFGGVDFKRTTTQQYLQGFDWAGNNYDGIYIDKNSYKNYLGGFLLGVNYKLSKRISLKFESNVKINNDFYISPISRLSIDYSF